MGRNLEEKYCPKCGNKVKLDRVHCSICDTDLLGVNSNILELKKEKKIEFLRNLKFMKITGYIFATVVFLLLLSAIIEFLIGSPQGYGIYLFYLIIILFFLVFSENSFKEKQDFRHNDWLPHCYSFFFGFAFVFLLLYQINTYEWFITYPGSIILICWVLISILSIMGGINYSYFMIITKSARKNRLIRIAQGQTVQEIRETFNQNLNKIRNIKRKLKTLKKENPLKELIKAKKEKIKELRKENNKLMIEMMNTFKRRIE
jgi:hypothetical protein